MMVTVVIIFGVCWLPYHLYFIYYNIDPSINYWEYIQVSGTSQLFVYIYSSWCIQDFYLAIYWLAMSNSMINPIIYCVMNNRFRQGFLQVFYFFTCRTNQHPTNIENSMAMGALAANNHNNYLRTTGPSTDRRFSNLSSIQINNTRNPSLNGNIK